MAAIHDRVNEILGITTYDGTEAIYLDTADAVLAAAGVCNPDLLVDPLYTVVRAWLTAHFYAIANPAYLRQSRTVNGAAVSYALPPPGVGLTATRFGRMALTLDPSGCLAKTTTATTRLGVTWLGTEAADA